MNKLVVILPLYIKNELDYLKETFKSLESQTYSNFDIIICKDGPLKKEVDDFINSQTRLFKIIIANNNKPVGLAKNLNKGIEIALSNSYEYIARMDGDDICLPERFEKQINFLEINKECDIVGGYIINIDAFGNSRDKIKLYPTSHQKCFNYFKKRSPLSHPTVMFRKSFFEKAGLYPTEILEKYSFVTKANSKTAKIFSKLLNTEFINFGGREDTLLWFFGFLNGCHFDNIPNVILKYRIIDYKNKHGKVSFRQSKQMFYERIIINMQLGYGIISYLYAIGRVILDISPGFVKKLMYKYLS